VEILGLGAARATVVTDIEQYHKFADEARAGDSAGLLLRGVTLAEVERGMVVAAAKSIVPQRTFEAELYVLTKEEGGRRTPFFAGYQPQFFFRTAGVTGAVSLAGGLEMVMPGDNVQVIVKLEDAVAIEPKQRFAVREGGKTVGSGVVTRILD
jgi:elongation factor Tu